MWSYATWTTSSGRSGSHDKSFPALQRLVRPAGDALAVCVRLRLRPIAPRVSVERILAIGREKLHQLEPLLVGKARADADVAEIPVVVVEAEQQGADRVLSPLLVPPETGDDAVGFALVFDLQHHSLVRLVGAVLGFRDDAVESRAFEAAKPVGGGRPVARRRRDVNRRLRVLEERFESCASFGEWCVAQALVALAEQIEEDNRRGDLSDNFFTRDSAG